jgi:hypothetical protein
MAGIDRSVVLGAGEQVSPTVAEDNAPVAVDNLPLRRDQLLELIPAELRENAEFSARRAAGGRPG